MRNTFGDLRNTLIANYANSSYEEKKSCSVPLAEKFSSFHDENEVICDVEINETVKKNDDIVKNQ